jgi:hypothetical protein
MSIALPVRRRRPAAKSSWVCIPKERLLSMLPAIVEFVTTPVTSLLGVSFLEREVQIFGNHWVSGRESSAADSRVGIREMAPEKRVGLILAPLGHRRARSQHERAPAQVDLESTVFSWVMDTDTLYFSAHDRGNDRPEHHCHTREARGESGLRRRPIEEAEGRQG